MHISIVEISIGLGGVQIVASRMRAWILLAVMDRSYMLVENLFGPKLFVAYSAAEDFNFMFISDVASTIGGTCIQFPTAGVGTIPSPPFMFDLVMVLC